MAADAFSLLAEPIQRCLWQMGWSHLRPIQASAIELVLCTEQDALISASTASGKTEAAFLPLLSRMYENPEPSVQALYVGPLKALINDQFRRVDELCTNTEIPVHRWHGDVAASKKASVLATPSGVLLITPESIESLFINRSRELRKLFRHLRFVVIDEVHAFVGCERGRHLRSLLVRLERYVAQPFRLLALSATLGNAEREYATWLRPENPDQVRLIDDSGGQRSIRFRINGYTVAKVDATRQQSDTPKPFLDDVYTQFAGRKNLIFANSKADIEYFSDLLNEKCRRAGRPPEFLVHHGSVSKDVREHTEELMRGSRPYTTLCSSTLELGIDIGNVAQVGQIGVPWSVASQVQRLGRSGRRDDEPSIMLVFLEEQAPIAGEDLIERIRPRLLQGIALTELMLGHWIEPPRVAELDFSTLIQQVLSVLVERGGATATELFDSLIFRGAFSSIDQVEFAQLLHCLAAHDLIEQTPQGDLILGLEGESIVRSYEFYSAFLTTPEYDVIYGSTSIGRLPMSNNLLDCGDHFLLGGRRWEILDIDAKRRQILVQLARKRKRPQFAGEYGEVHTVVRQEMRDLLLTEKQIAYLNDEAREWLVGARATALESGMGLSPWIEHDAESCDLYPWVGTRTLRAMELLAKHARLDVTRVPNYQPPIALRFRSSRTDVQAAIHRTLGDCPSAETLASLMPTKHLRKYDEYLNETLLHRNLAESAINLPEAVATLTELIAAT